MKILGKYLDRYLDLASSSFGTGLIFSNINQTSLRLYFKYTILLGVPAILIDRFVSFPLGLHFFLVVCMFLIVVAFRALYDESFRPKVLNNRNEFVNTKYILYFIIYTGLAGILIACWDIFGWWASLI